MTETRMLTRRQAHQRAVNRGIPISWSRFQLRCIPSQNLGPRSAGKYGKYDMYRVEEVDEWINRELASISSSAAA
jgi:hypothetical protein